MDQNPNNDTNNIGAASQNSAKDFVVINTPTVIDPAQNQQQASVPFTPPIATTVNAATFADADPFAQKSGVINSVFRKEPNSTIFEQPAIPQTGQTEQIISPIPIPNALESAVPIQLPPVIENINPALPPQSPLQPIQSVYVQPAQITGKEETVQIESLNPLPVEPFQQPKSVAQQIKEFKPIPVKPNIMGTVQGSAIQQSTNVAKFKISKSYEGKGKRKSQFKNINQKTPIDDLIFSLQNLSIMLKTGLPVQEALSVISTQAQSKALRDTYASVLKDINSGMSLANSMRKYSKAFSPLLTSIVDAGEQSGSLEKNLSYMADYMKKNNQLKKKIKAALFYPLIIIGLTSVELIGVIFFILPQLDTFFSTLPSNTGPTAIILGSGRFLRSNGLLLLISSIFIFVGLVIFLKTLPGKYSKDFLLLKVPIIRKLTKEVTLANFARTFGTLLQSGIPMYNALNLSKQTIDNVLYVNALKKIEKKVLSGSSLSDGLKDYPDIFPSIFTKMLQVGEEAGALESNLISMHEYYTGEAEELSNNFATLIEPVLLIFVGIVVFILAISIIVPLYSVVSNLHV